MNVREAMAEAMRQQSREWSRKADEFILKSLEAYKPKPKPSKPRPRPR